MIQGSISTATSRIRPRKAGTAPGGREAMAWTCISWSPTLSVRVIGTPSRSTLSIRTTRIAPRQEPSTRPRPPMIEAPPTITAAMTISSAPRPYCEVTPLSWATFIRPASVAHKDASTNPRMRTSRVSMPAYSAASALPPTA